MALTNLSQPWQPEQQRRVSTGGIRMPYQPTTAGGSSVTGPAAASIPPVGKWKDHMILQKVRLEDLKVDGHSDIQDQGVIFVQGVAYDTLHPSISQEYNGIPGFEPKPQPVANGNRGGGRDRPPHMSPGGGNNPPSGPPSDDGNGGDGGGGGDPPRRPPSADSNYGPPPPPGRNPGRGGRGGGPPGSPGSPGNGGAVVEADDSPPRRIATHRFSMPPAVHRTRYTTPGVEEAHEYHRQTMHNCLLQIIDELLGTHLTVPEGTKPCRSDASKTITPYAGSLTFGELENWLMSVCIHFAVAQYGGDGRDRENVLVMMDFLTGDAHKWYLHHVIHVHRRQVHWSFVDVIIGLYDRFVLPMTMQDAREAFRNTSFNTKEGVQEYYDTLLEHAQNMVMYPEEDRGLSPEVNTLEDFVSEVKAYENSVKTAAHYLEQSAHQKGGRVPSLAPTTFQKQGIRK
ncbi:hypothetical protein H0H92_004939 [Tricholoma furcatifolium]|nr:hypothetical protein H0H92_004939 [Tricholoma furcatifolium]